MGRIAVLPDHLINQIAAGEVVERPASVVKELCENALDAGATRIRVQLEGGGLRSIAIIDDGIGMSREDAQLALERHATSKLRNLEGLSRLTTMGFRGEALPTIASVSRFRLTTCEEGAATGTRLTREGGGPLHIEDAPLARGTTVVAEDLFFNTPARRKFMKREATELVHAQEAVFRIALAHREVAFTLEHQGATLFSSPAHATDLRERIAAALGPDVHRHLLAVEERQLGLHVHGFAASPEYSLSTSRGLYVFVNGRYVRDRALNHAIGRAYQDALGMGRHPVVVLYLELDPADVDVNVHPQKLEVRFTDPRGVGDAVFNALARGLRAAPWRKEHPAEAPGGAPHYAFAVEQFLARAREGQGFAPVTPTGEVPSAAESSLAFGQAAPGVNEAAPEGYFTALRVVGRLGGRFALCEGPGGSLVVLDAHAACERVHLEAFHARATAGELPPQRSLFARSLDLPKELHERAVRGGETLLRLGIEVEPFGLGSVAIKAVPDELGAADPVLLLRGLLPLLPDEGPDGDLGPALRFLACEAAKLEGEAALDGIAQRLPRLDVPAPLRATHDKPVVLEVTLLELVRRAGL
jgi:DNA mismatch repair protein MutL